MISYSKHKLFTKFVKFVKFFFFVKRKTKCKTIILIFIKVFLVVYVYQKNNMLLLVKFFRLAFYIAILILTIKDVFE